MPNKLSYIKVRIKIELDMPNKLSYIKVRIKIFSKIMR